MAEAQALFADELVPSAAGSPVGTVGVIDESAFTKKGSHSAGVARQHNGRLGKEDNCQVGVFLIGVAPAGAALLDHRLFLPESWCEATRRRWRRDAAHIPEDLPFRTKPQIAAELVRNVAVLGQVELDWVVADAEYGRAGTCSTSWSGWSSGTCSRCRRRRCSGRRPGRCVPAYSGRAQADEPPGGTRCARWPSSRRVCQPRPGRRLQVREGAPGPLVFEFAAVRVWGVRHRKPGPPFWLLIRRSLEGEPELKYYVCNADAETPLRRWPWWPARGARWRSSSRTARATWG